MLIAVDRTDLLEESSVIPDLGNTVSKDSIVSKYYEEDVLHNEVYRVQINGQSTVPYGDPVLLTASLDSGSFSLTSYGLFVM